MLSRFTFAVGAAAGCAVVVGLLAGAGKRPSARLEALVRGSSGVQRWARGPSAGQAQSAFGRAIAKVGATRGARDGVSGGTAATSGGVIPLESVPMDQLSEWELDLLTTPDS